MFAFSIFNADEIGFLFLFLLFIFLACGLERKEKGGLRSVVISWLCDYSFSLVCLLEASLYSPRFTGRFATACPSLYPREYSLSISLLRMYARQNRTHVIIFWYPLVTYGLLLASPAACLVSAILPNVILHWVFIPTFSCYEFSLFFLSLTAKIKKSGRKR